ncbi:MAG TPA: ABC transporter permease subunit [Candidatus Limnocylindrales bacterium]|nr:ABC transporter permease subunit [Candidatus Limnocylindrales bacterium]
MSGSSSERAAAERLVPSALSRVYGLGSVFGKHLSDAGRTMVIVGLLLGGVVLATASQVALEFDTLQARQGLAAQMQMLPPLFSGLLGEPINVQTLGGFISWRTLGAMPLLIGIWSISALSGTLAGEAGRGTLEMVLAAPVSRRSLALQKLLAHAAALGGALFIAGVLIWLSTLVFAVLPGDEAGLVTVLSELAYTFAIALLFGAIAFAAGTLLTRGMAAGAGGAALFGSYIINGYADLVPGFDVLRLGSPFYWTTQHRPLAGVTDWPALMLVLSLAAAFGLLGVLLFQRRDLGATVAFPTGRAGRLAVRYGLGWSLRGPGRRAFAERLPDAIGWGAGLGLYGLVIALSAEQFAAMIESVPEIGAIIRRFFPDVDLATAGGVLQMTMFSFATLIFGLAGAALVSGWAGEETNRKTELVLAAPLRRFGWAVRTSLAVIAAMVVMSLLTALGTAAGAALMDDPVAGPIAGSLALGLYGMALMGAGFVIAGLGWPRLAGVATAGLTIGLYLLNLIGGALRLPEEVLNLALSRHLGQPMAGSYDLAGILLCACLALGGLLLGALAFTRRDLT